MQRKYRQAPALLASSAARFRGRIADAGLTLLELMIVLAVVSVLMSIAIPGFGRINAHNQLAASANQLLTAMATARQVAIVDNTSVTFCAGTPSEGCDEDWSAKAWIVFVDVDRDGEIDAEDQLRRAGQLDSSPAVEISGNGPFRHRVVFTADGGAERASGAFAAGRLRVCAENAFSPNATDLVLIGSGRVVTERHDFEGVCDAL